MAIVTLKEYAELLGMPYNTAKQNATRKNIIKGTDGKIDTENPTNKVFFNQKKAELSTRVPKSKPETKEKSVEKPTGLTTEQKIYADLDYRTKVATAESKERENEIKRIQLEKQAGNLLPVDLVEKVLVINMQSIFKGLESETENMASIYVERFGGNRKDLAEITQELRVAISKIITKAQKDAEHEIDGAVNEFQDVRGRGQKK